MHHTIASKFTLRRRWIGIAAVIAGAAAIATAAQALPGAAHHGKAAFAQPITIAPAHGAAQPAGGGSVSFPDPTPPVFDPGTGGWTGPYPYYTDPYATDPTPPVFDPGTGGWTGPYPYGDPTGGVYDPGTGGWTG